MRQGAAQWTNGMGVSAVAPQPKEPWVTLQNGRDLTTWSRKQEIVYNQMNRQVQKLAFFVNAFDFLSANQIHGDYYEFGCHGGRTFRMALTEARRHDFRQMRFFAFDSFEGLPEVSGQPGIPLWQKGALGTSETAFRRLIARHGIYVERCHIVKGFYQDTLTKRLQRRVRSSGRRIALSCVDCDLYESAVPVFRFIEPLLQEGAMLYLDDYFVGYRGSSLNGVARAFREFERVSRFTFVPHLQVGWWGRSFIASPSRRRKPVTRGTAA